MGYLIAFYIVAYVVVVFALLYAAFEIHWIFNALLALWIILGLGFVTQSLINKQKTGPCVEQETQMHFNPATKTMMPATVCVNRGEWVTQ